MSVYKNDHAAQIYPFISSVPFPLGWVQDIKLALKKVSEPVFVTAVSVVKDVLHLELQTNSSYIGYFLTAKGWFTIDNLQAFGFIKVGLLSGLLEAFTGRWLLNRACYTFPVTLAGISQVSVNGVPLTINLKNTLKLLLSGDLTTRPSEGLVVEHVINIGRDSDPHTDYNNVITYKDTYTGISSVNAASVLNLVITSEDPSWLNVCEIQVVGNAANKNYVLYLLSGLLFDNCDGSDSQETYYSPALLS